MPEGMDGLPTTLRERALDNIKARILASKPGEFISEMGLAKSLNISRTPVREALHQLASQGLVQRVPHVGSFVAPLTTRVVREIMEVREALEGRAAGLAAGRMSSDEYLALRAGLDISLQITGEAERFVKMEEAGQAVHSAVLKHADNRRIIMAIDDLRDQIHRVQAFALGLPGRMEKSHREHEAILEAVRSGDPRQAEWRMREHLEGTKQTLLQQIEQEERGEAQGSTPSQESREET